VYSFGYLLCVIFGCYDSLKIGNEHNKYRDFERIFQKMLAECSRHELTSIPTDADEDTIRKIFNSCTHEQPQERMTSDRVCVLLRALVGRFLKRPEGVTIEM
jgi:hypothetical protein